MLPFPHVPESLEFLEFALHPTNGTLLPDGFALLTAMGGLYMGDASFFPVYEILNGINATVFIHPGDPVNPPELTFIPRKIFLIYFLITHLSRTRLSRDEVWWVRGALINPISTSS
jgi:hypothetical protein